MTKKERLLLEQTEAKAALDIALTTFPADTQKTINLFVRLIEAVIRQSLIDELEVNMKRLKKEIGVAKKASGVVKKASVKRRRKGVK